MSEDALFATLMACLFAVISAYHAGILYSRAADPKRLEDAHKERLQAQNDLAEAKRERDDSEDKLKRAIKQSGETIAMIERHLKVHA